MQRQMEEGSQTRAAGRQITARIFGPSAPLHPDCAQSALLIDWWTALRALMLGVT